MPNIKEQILNIALNMINKKHPCTAVKREFCLDRICFEIINNFRTYQLALEYNDNIKVHLYSWGKTFTLTAEVIVENPKMREELIEAVDTLINADTKYPFNQ